MKKTTLYVLLAGCVVVLLATFVFPGDFQFYRTLKSFHAENVAYDSADSAKTLYRHVEDVHSDVNVFQLSMEFEPTSIGAFNNAFQTASGNGGLRLELSKPGNLALIAAAQNTDGYLVFLVTDKLSLRRWHRLALRVDSEKHITVNLDGQTAVDETDPDMAYDISDVEIGAGFDGARPFVGQIKDASFSYRLLSGTGWLTIFRAVLILAAFLLLFLTNWLDIPRQGEGDAGQPNGALLGKGDPPRRGFRGDEV